MKVQITAQDMEIVGYFNGTRQFCIECSQETDISLSTPVFAKAAQEYKLACSLCGKALVNPDQGDERLLLPDDNGIGSTF